MPADVVATLNGEINKVLMLDEVRRKFSVEALDPMPMTPAEFTKFIQADIQRWVRVSKDRGIVITD